MKKLILLLLLLPLVCLSGNSDDSLKNGKKHKNIYPLDDPRNPDCPCHELQKKADEEYRAQLEKEKRERHAEENQSAEVSPEKTIRYSAFGRKISRGKHHKRHTLKRKRVKDLLDDCPDF